MTGGEVRDPVHGYVPLTSIERALLNDRLAQRLRYIGQSAAAHLVFPSMTVTRFAHSLGAMHVASRFLKASLANAHLSTRENVVAAMTALARDTRPAALGRSKQAAGDLEQLLRSHGLDGYVNLADPYDRVATLIVEQALRLVSLLHDLGHLPFSHDFEMALQEVFTRHPELTVRYPNLGARVEVGSALHEAIGYQLADWVRDDLDETLRDLVDPDLVDPAHDAIAIAKRILHSEQPGRAESDEPADHVARWLLSLVSGEIDADRCDYILRDSRNYGLIGAGYDLDRLIANVGVAEVDDRVTRWETVVMAHGASAAEEFLVARFRMYQWGIYHHKIQQCSAGLRYALRSELRREDGEPRQFLDDLEQLLAHDTASEPDRVRPAVDRFADYTDGWWLEHLKRRLRDHTWRESHPDVVDWLSLFVYRKSGPRSLWKKATDLEPDQLRELNKAAAVAETDPGPWTAAVRDLDEQDGVLVVPLPWSPWKAVTASNNSEQQVSRLRIWDPRDSTLRALSIVSPLVNGLAEAWQMSLQVLAFARDGKTLADADKRLTLVTNVVARLVETSSHGTDSGTDSKGEE